MRDLKIKDMFEKYNVLGTDILSIFMIIAHRQFKFFFYNTCITCLIRTKPHMPGHVAQSETPLATDGCPAADSGVASWILAQSHTFVGSD